MFLPSDQACSFTPNSQNFAVPADVAFCDGQINGTAAQISNANSGWQSLLGRNWQSFADQGVNVAYQLRSDAPDSIPAASAAAGSSVAVGGGQNSGSPAGNGGGAGVFVLSPDPSSGNPAIASPGVGRRRGPRVGSDGQSILDAFHYQPEFKTYTGPLPTQGTVKSLVIGGANRPGPTGGGAPAVSSPAAGSGGGICPTQTGIAMLPWGEPDYWAATAGAVGSSSAFPWLALAAIVGAAYLLSGGSDSRRGR